MSITITAGEVSFNEVENNHDNATDNPSCLPEEVYNAFMDSKKHSEFTKSKATGKGVVGSQFTAGDGYISGRNLELEKGKRILQEWTTTEWPKGYPPSKLELTFKKIKDNTELTMVQSCVPRELEEGLRQGWIKHYWEPLKQYFEKKDTRV